MYSYPYLSGGYPCLRVIFTLERNYGYHIISTFIPTAFIVVVSWVSFWISPEAVPGRVTLGVTTVLTFITQSFVAGLSTPEVPYVKAIDVWMAVNMVFVFLALLEYAVVNVLYRTHKNEPHDPPPPSRFDSLSLGFFNNGKVRRRTLNLYH